LQEFHVLNFNPVTETTTEKVKFELPGVEYDRASTNLKSLFPRASNSNKIDCVESIALSSWNPVPFQQRMKGDFHYLTIVTLEGKRYHVTCSAKGFFVNRSTDSVFSAEKSELFGNYLTLPELLGAISPQFLKNFALLRKELGKIHPCEYLMTFNHNYPWTISPPENKNDPGRMMDQVLSAVDTLNTLCARDWNEDLQSAKELPKNSAQNRVYRDQAVCRSNAEYIEAALKGAMGVINGTIPSISAADDELSKMYIHNNIFFSEGYDNREQYEKYGGREAAHAATGKDIDGIRLVESCGFDDIYTLGTAVIDYKGQRVVAQTIVPGILKRSDESESAVQYGSADGGQAIETSPILKEHVSKLAKALNLKEHVVLDGNGVEHTISTSLETKWVTGTDSRKYVLDLYRINPVDASFLEAVKLESDNNPYPHEIALLRPELIELYHNHKLRAAIQEHQDSTTSHENKEDESEAKPDFKFSLLFNPDSFTRAKLGGNSDTIKADEETIRDASGFISVMISQFLMEIVRSSTSIPVETVELTNAMHRRGINMRYLGKLATLFDQLTDFHVESWKLLLREEMIARAAKHILRDRLAPVSIYEAPTIISDFLNGLFGIETDIQKEVEKQIKSRFRYDLPQGSWDNISVTLLRSICLKVGIQILARDYDFKSADCFTADDILNLYPIVKSHQPKAAFAEEALENGRACLAQDQKDLGLELIRESCAMYEQVYGPVHPRTGSAYASLAMLYFESEQLSLALATQRRSIIVCERTLGLDSPESLKKYVIEILN
jgi:protein TIF31